MVTKLSLLFFPPDWLVSLVFDSISPSSVFFTEFPFLRCLTVVISDNLEAYLSINSKTLFLLIVSNGILSLRIIL